MLLALALIAALPQQPAQAQAGNVFDLIAEVNTYRAANGLEAYQIDNGLMSVAQSQSDYMASIRTCTHTRADGSGPGTHGVSAENIACGANLTVQGAIYSQWTDALHSATILGPESGLVGAGMATSGNNVYYTLDVKLGRGSFTYRPPKQPTAPSSVGGNTVTPNHQLVPLRPLITATPNPDGSIKHVIQYGENLIAIAQAYGITLNQLYALNPSLNPASPVYYAGQTLVIRQAPTLTVTPTLTRTPRPPTRTPIPTWTPRPTATDTVTLTPSRTPLFGIQAPEPGPRLWIYAVILLCAIGIVYVLVRGFFLNRK